MEREINWSVTLRSSSCTPATCYGETQLNDDWKDWRGKRKRKTRRKGEKWLRIKWFRRAASSTGFPLQGKVYKVIHRVIIRFKSHFVNRCCWIHFIRQLSFNNPFLQQKQNLMEPQQQFPWLTELAFHPERGASASKTFYAVLWHELACFWQVRHANTETQSSFLSTAWPLLCSPLQLVITDMKVLSSSH